MQEENRRTSVDCHLIAQQTPNSEGNQTEVAGFPDWRAADAGNGAVYYYNVVTKTTSWYHPGMLNQVKQSDYNLANMNLSSLSPEEVQKLYQERLEHMQKLQQQYAELSSASGLGEADNGQK